MIDLSNLLNKINKLTHAAIDYKEYTINKDDYIISYTYTDDLISFDFNKINYPLMAGIIICCAIMETKYKITIHGKKPKLDTMTTVRAGLAKNVSEEYRDKEDVLNLTHQKVIELLDNDLDQYALKEIFKPYFNHAILSTHLSMHTPLKL